MAAHGLGVAREAARQIGGGADHGASRDQAAARALARSSGWRSRSAAKDRRAAIFGGRHEEPQAPGDDFRGEAERLQLRHGAVGIAGELDAMRVHHQRAADLQIAGEIEHGAAIDDGAPGFVRRKAGGAVDAERLIERCERFGRDEAADDALAVIGLEAVDAHVRRPAAGPRSAAAGR